jgi:hypothetical protein
MRRLRSQEKTVVVGGMLGLFLLLGGPQAFGLTGGADKPTASTGCWSQGHESPAPNPEFIDSLDLKTRAQILQQSSGLTTERLKHGAVAPLTCPVDYLGSATIGNTVSLGQVAWTGSENYDLGACVVVSAANDVSRTDPNTNGQITANDLTVVCPEKS